MLPGIAFIHMPSSQPLCLSLFQFIEKGGGGTAGSFGGVFGMPMPAGPVEWA